jgi:probable HAF family extracellular repeat protein
MHRHREWSVLGLLAGLIVLAAPITAYAREYNVTTLGTATTTGYAINAGGQVTGDWLTAEDVDRAFLVTPEGGVTDLGTLGGATSTGYAINARGQVTGESVTADGATHAFLYRDGKIRDLNAMLDRRTAAHVMLTSGRGINDAGWILARGTDSRSGEMHTYVLTAY